MSGGQWRRCACACKSGLEPAVRAPSRIPLGVAKIGLDSASRDHFNRRRFFSMASLWTADSPARPMGRPPYPSPAFEVSSWRTRRARRTRRDPAFPSFDPAFPSFDDRGFDTRFSQNSPSGQSGSPNGSGGCRPAWSGHSAKPFLHIAARFSRRLAPARSLIQPRGAGEYQPALDQPDRRLLARSPDGRLARTAFLDIDRGDPARP